MSHKSQPVLRLSNTKLSEKGGEDGEEEGDEGRESEGSSAVPHVNFYHKFSLDLF